MKWLQQKWYDVSIRTKSMLLMGIMLAVTWVLVALVMIQLHTFSERSSVIMDEYMDITGFMDTFSAENASLEAYMRPIQPIDAKEDYLAAIQMTNRCLEELCPDLQADRREEYALKRAIRNAMSYYRESQHVLLDAEKPSEMIEHYLLLKTQSFYIDGYTRDLLHSQMVQGGMQWQEIDRINARSSKQFVAFLIVATVLMGLTLVVFKRSILAPLAALGQAADAISAGHYEAPPVVVRGDDELGRTAKSFNLMQAEIRHTIWALEKQSEMEKHLLEKEVEAAQMQKKLQEGRFAQLQSQINPHFLYNTLDTMKWVAKANHIPEIATMAAGLAKILRTSISKRQFIYLKEELELVNCYVDIQKIRFNDKFTYSVEMEEGLEECVIPKLIIQPIVENSVLHGLKESEEGNIRVQITGKNGVLCIEVTDDGCGAPEEQMEAINHRRQEQLVGHIGVSNVDTIIRLHYGKDYGLRAERLAAGGTKVTIRIPVNGSGEPDPGVKNRS